MASRQPASWPRRLPWLLLLAASLPAWAATDVADLSLEELMQVTVVGASKYEQKQSEVAAAISVITRQEIRAHGWRTLDAALASLPGVYTTYDRQYAYLGTRGFGMPGDFNTRVLLTIDGNRVNDAVYDQAYIGRDFPLDMELVERIEFLPGPGGAVYGPNAMFGVINVVTRTGASWDGAELAGSWQQPQRTREGRLSWGRQFDNGFDVAISASGMRSRGEDLYLGFGDSGLAGVAAGLDGESDSEFFLRAARGPWSFEYVQGNRRKDDPTGVYLSDPLVPGTYQRDRMALSQLQYQDQPGDGALQLSARLYASQERYFAPETFGGDPTLSTVASNWHGLELRAVYSAWPGHKLMLGMEYQANPRQDQTFDDFAATPGVLDTNIPQSGWRTGLYAQDEWRVTDKASATIGLRADRNSVVGNALSPRAALIWQGTAATSLRALYGRAHRAPNVYEHDYDDGVTLIANRALRGESIDTFEFVLDHRVGHDLTLRTSVYRWLMQGLISQGLDPASGLPQYRNGNDVHAAGLELSADRTWLRGARLRGSLTYEHVADVAGARLPNSPELLAKLNLSVPLAASGVHLGYELQYSSARRTLDGSDLGGYCLSNLHLTAERWVRGLELAVGLDNLFDVRYAQPGSRNNWQNSLQQDGRSVQLGFRYAH